VSLSNPAAERAKTLLARRSVRYDEVDVSNIPNFRQWLSELTGGRTVPQIIIDGVPIGGADRLARLDRCGVLTAIAQNEPFLDHAPATTSLPRLGAALDRGNAHRAPRDLSVSARRAKA